MLCTHSVICLLSDGQVAAFGSRSSRSGCCLPAAGFLANPGAGAPMTWVGTAGTGTTGMDKCGCRGVAATLNYWRRAGATGNVRGSMALCTETFPAPRARAFHSLPPFPAFVT